MSSSTDSLKKKVCVTVFLDELFEEVLDEDWKNLKQTESEVSIEDKQLKHFSEIDLNNEEKVKFCPSSNTEQVQIQFRPRKHRKESKFSKNYCNSFKNKFTKNKYSSRGKTENEVCEHSESAPSDSDFDLGEFLESSRSSFSEPSDADMTEESYLSVNPVGSLKKVCLIKPEKNSRKKASFRTGSCAPICHKSTQFDGLNFGEGECRQEKVSDEGRLAEERALAWTKTQRQIHLILAKAMNRHVEEENCKKDGLRLYDLRSILEECAGTEESISSKGTLVHSDYILADSSADLQESDGFDLSDSYPRVLPHDQQTTKVGASDLKKVWTSAQKIDGFESDPSETDVAHCTKLMGLQALRNDSVLCYSLRLKCEETEKQNGDSDAVESFVYSETTSKESSLDSLKSKGSRETDSACKALIRVANAEALSKLKAEKEIRNFVSPEKNLPGGEGRNKNFAEGDTCEKPSKQDSKFILNVKEKEKLFVCNEILKHVVESNVIHNKIVVNRAEMDLGSTEQTKTKAKLTNSCAPKELAEVLFKKNLFGSFEKNIIDVESEMVFAESENFRQDEGFSGKGLARSLSVRVNSQPNDICVLDFEGKLSRSKILRRMKTVEIVKNSSLAEMKNISTEVILICENISNNEVCLEAWQSSASTLKSLTEMNECYLKDSKDSAMYLIEIPLHFTNAKQKKLSDSEHISETSDSD